MATSYPNPVVVLDDTEYEALISSDTRNQLLIGVYLNALRYMVRLYHVADEAYDKNKETDVQLHRLLKQFGLDTDDDSPTGS